MCESLAKAIGRDVRAKNKVLSQKTEDILKEIHKQFSEIVDEKIDDAAERGLREVFKTFLEKAEPKFEDVKADLARIKRRYGM